MKTKSVSNGKKFQIRVTIIKLAQTLQKGTMLRHFTHNHHANIV